MSFSTHYRRVGLIVPSSNITMETEIPALLKAREAILPDRFTFHSSRMRMKSVVKAELEAMDADSDGTWISPKVVRKATSGDG
jgi:maleate isomerase